MQCIHCGSEHDPAQGGFCAACGMWVGKPRGAAAPAAAIRPAAADPTEAKCDECGVPTGGRLRCVACGARLKRAEDQLDVDEQRELDQRRRIRARLARGAVAAVDAAPAAADIDLLAAPPPAPEVAAPAAAPAVAAPAAAPAAAAPLAAAPAPVRIVPAAPPNEDLEEMIFEAVQFDDPPPAGSQRPR
ncbi:MAG TPA: hypothetical protein VGQ83_14245 [Polyangia bacterium]